MQKNYEAMDQFCGSTFWNSTLTWNTEDPDFTICFEKTIFASIPALIFWTFVPLEIYYLKKSPNKDIPWNWKNVLKILITSAICLICFADFCANLSEDVPLVKVDIFMPLVKFVTFVFAGILIYYNKIHGLQASGHQFAFWFLNTLCSTPQFRTEIRLNFPRENGFSHKTFAIFYPLSCIMFLLSCLADENPRQDVNENIENVFPIVRTGFLGRLIFAYFDPLLYKGFKRPLEIDDMWNLEFQGRAGNLVPKFEGELLKQIKSKEQQKGKKRQLVSIFPLIFKCFYSRFLTAGIIKTCVELLTFVNPQILSLLIGFVGSDEPKWKGFLYASGFFVFGSFQTILNNAFFVNNWYFGLHARTCLLSCIYRKSLRISNATRKNKTVGEIVNLMAADAERFQDFALSLPIVWLAPMHMILSVYFLWREVGIAALAGIIVLILLIPVNAIIVRKTKRLQIKQMRNKDERLKTMGEILNGIRVLKLYAWEISFEKIVQKIRSKEIATLLKAAYLGAATSFIWNCAPFIIAFVVFGTYVMIDENHILDASKVFVSLSLINIMRTPMNQVPNVLNSIAQTMVSFRRINSFLNAEELEPYIQKDQSEKDPLLIENGTFTWGDAPVLKSINFRAEKDTITAIVGPVGCGKSSLINALLGEMDKESGRVNTLGTVAYVSQQAWIQNATLRENIVFGKPFDKARYEAVLEACALRPDLAMLSDMDMTEIGEKGINLSGGQKQRISLARAVYEDADIYLLDDPLSAVDSHVGKHIFGKVIGPEGLLRGKVRVLVTHAITYLPKTHKIYVINDGSVQESGTYRELLNEKGAFADFLMQHIGDEINDEEELNELEEQVETTSMASEIKRKISRQRSRISESSSNPSMGRSMSVLSLESVKNQKNVTLTSKLSLQDKELKKNKKGQLIESEREEKGNIKLSVYKYYFSAIGFWVILGTLTFFIGFQAFGIESSIWLGRWAEDPNVTIDGKVDTGLRNMYLLVYGALGLMQGFCVWGANVWFAKGTTSAARKLHNVLLGTVMRLPMAFFDVTPTGRILARFASDIIGIDLRLPSEFNNFFQTVLKVLGTITVICYATPLFIVVIIPVGIFYVFIQRYFVSTTRQVKRLESVYRSPIYSHFSETVSGTTVIRAYRCQKRFINESEDRINRNQRCTYTAAFANRWLSVRLETIGNVIIFFAAVFAVLSKNLNASLVGLSVSYALQITQALTLLVRHISDAETSIVSVERIKEYSETQQEKPWIIPEKKPAKSWPDNGKVDFLDYSVRYRPGLDLVLRNVSFSVNGGEKIGIVGRTGAGKSSLTLALFRIIEAGAGKISIDGTDISQLGLHDLRSKLTIIPQDAVLFSGNLRLNLDPFEAYSDPEVWTALEQAHLKKFVSSLPAGLNHPVSEGGINLSSGQRQLICLARALLRKTKILVLDEATAAVDLETDDLIQKTIKSEFRECTIITIAHRLNTIIDSNRVLVLDRGQIAEFDSPAVLLQSKGVFYGMCKDAGLCV